MSIDPRVAHAPPVKVVADRVLPEGGEVVVVDGTLTLPMPIDLAEATFNRAGDDLEMIMADGSVVVVVGYFALIDPPGLAAEFGAALGSDDVAARAGTAGDASVPPVAPAAPEAPEAAAEALAAIAPASGGTEAPPTGAAEEMLMSALDPADDLTAAASFGGPGDDILEGGPGVDIMAGGDGADRFVFGDPAESVAFATDGMAPLGDGQHDLILDFEAGVDRVVLDAKAFGLDGPLELGTTLFILDGPFDGTNAGAAPGVAHVVVDFTGTVYFDDGTGEGYAVVTEIAGDAPLATDIVSY